MPAGRAPTPPFLTRIRAADGSHGPVTRHLLLFLFVPALTLAAITPTLEKRPDYFYDFYGKAVSEKVVDTYGFVDSKAGEVAVKGRFMVREYRTEGMHVTVVYVLPELKAAAVQFDPGREWTAEQISAVLAGYGSAWDEGSTDMFRFYLSKEGAKAITVFNHLQINSAGVEAELAKIRPTVTAERK